MTLPLPRSVLGNITVGDGYFLPALPTVLDSNYVYPPTPLAWLNANLESWEATRELHVTPTMKSPRSWSALPLLLSLVYRKHFVSNLGFDYIEERPVMRLRWGMGTVGL